MVKAKNTKDIPGWVEKRKKQKEIQNTVVTTPVINNGPVGKQGPIGDKGPTGDKGPIGDQGPVGPVGSSSTPALMAINHAGNKHWVKYTYTYSDFSAALATNSLTVCDLPAKTVIHNAILKHSIPFAGSGLFTYSIQVGIIGKPNHLIAMLNTFATVNDTNYSKLQVNVKDQPLSFANSVPIIITATSSPMLNKALSGSVDLWIEISTLE